MARFLKSHQKARVTVLASVLIAAGVTVMVTRDVTTRSLSAASQTAQLRATGEAQLISVAPLPHTQSDAEMCEWMPASAENTLMEQQSMLARSAAADNPPTSVNSVRAPVRVIKDTYPTYSAIGVDPRTGEVFLQDE